MGNHANPLRRLEEFGQSVWLDYVRRRLLGSDEFRRMLREDGLKGMTSNPTIFDKAISGSDDYEDQLSELAGGGKSVEDIYEDLTITDIRTAADALRPVYDQSSSRCGYVSYEVSPLLAFDTEATIQAARRLRGIIDRPNVMIKVPATPAGIPAIEQLISEGININVTLIFSMRHYEAVAEAYLRGIERRAQAGASLENVASVASLFVSRLETLTDKRIDEGLESTRNEALTALKGKAAVANAKLIYQRFKDYFSGERFAALSERGARVQQPLWASTGTKNPAYSDIKYVQELIGPQTVNTIPPATMDAFRDHGEPCLTLESGVEEARRTVDRLHAEGIDLIGLGEELQDQGVKSFAKSFEDLLSTIGSRREAVLKRDARK